MVHTFACRVLVLAAGVWLCASPAAAQAKKPLKEIDVDLRAAIINDTLPFDERFVVTALIDDSVTDVEAWIVEMAAVDGALVCPVPEAPGWRPTTKWNGKVPAGVPPAAVETARKFRLVFPMLDVNRFYCVRFELGPGRELTPAELSTFRTRLTALLDEALRPFAMGEQVTTLETLALRRRILAALRELSPAETPRARKGSIFDPTRPAASVHAEFKQMLDPVVNSQVVRGAVVNNSRIAGNALSQSAAAVQRAADELVLPAPARSAAVVSNRPALTKWLATRNVATTATLQSVSQAITTWDLAVVGDASTKVAASRIRNQEGADLVKAIQDAATSAPLTVADTAAVDRLAAALADEVDAFDDVDFRLGEMAKLLGNRLAVLNKQSARFEETIVGSVNLVTTSQGNFETRHGWYVSMDAGLAYGWDINEAFGYLGTNIYFRPVNKDAPLQNFGNFAQSFSRRVSALIGLTVSGQTTQTGRREALIGSRVVVIGGGVRITDSIRLNAGALVFKAVNPNPLITERRVETSPFFSMSYDIDVVGTLGDLGRAFGLVTAQKTLPAAQIRGAR